jgi:hypothetical protein
MNGLLGRACRQDIRLAVRRLERAWSGGYLLGRGIGKGFVEIVAFG